MAQVRPRKTEARDLTSDGQTAEVFQYEWFVGILKDSKVSACHPEP